MAEIHDIGELLKVLYRTLGRRPTKVIVWLVAAAGLVWATKTTVEGIDLANESLYGCHNHMGDGLGCGLCCDPLFLHAV